MGWEEGSKVTCLFRVLVCMCVCEKGTIFQPARATNGCYKTVDINVENHQERFVSNSICRSYTRRRGLGLLVQITSPRNVVASVSFARRSRKSRIPWERQTRSALMHYVYETVSQGSTTSNVVYVLCGMAGNTSRPLLTLQNWIVANP